MTDLHDDTSYTRPAALVARQMGVDPAVGLTLAQVAQRRAHHGPNQLRARERRRIGVILVHQLEGVIVWLLAIAAVLSFVFRDIAEGVAILVVLAINTAIGFFTEWRAARSMEALLRIGRVSTRVRRAGGECSVDAQDLVPGDIVVLEAGDIVTADLRLVQAANLHCDESVLTGESVPVRKHTDPVAPGAVPGDRRCMAFKGTAVTQGTGEGIVTATGMATELGRITHLVQSADAADSPLERRLDRLGQGLVWLTLALAALTILAGVLRGHALAGMVQTGVALAVAAVPEGLPVVATLSLARGMLRMAARNAVITNLSAVETLGATTVILTDKTGTLTENRMTVVRYLLAGAQVEVLGQGGAVRFRSGTAALSADTDMRLAAALRVGALCNGAALGQADDAPASGDPMEVALLHVARAAGHGRTSQLQARAEIAEHAFDPGLKMMASVHRDGAGVFFAVKGAPEAVIAACTHVLGPEGPETLDPAGRADWVRRSHDAARDGLRLLALAMKQEARPDAPPYAGLTLVGLACLRDPLRTDVRAAVAAARGAGVRVVMMTGDHAQTAAAIARQAGLADGAITVIEGHDLHDLDPDGMPEARRQQLLAADVFARVTPETKLGLARLFQRSDHIVAMTGDGVNDAPALKQADIGIAMGLRGTDVAREAAQMVLKDDALGTIIAAMQQGRMIFDNIRKFVVYLMSCNVSEVLIVGLAVGAGLPMPLLPLQILFLNLVTDVFPAFALGLGQGEDGSMQRPPRAPSEPIVGRHGWVRIGVLGGAITVATLAAFGGALNWLHLPVGPAITVAFVTLALAQLWNVFNMRAAGSAMLRNDITCNPWIWAAIGFCLLLTGMALWLPLLSGVLKLPDPGWQGLALAAGASLFPLLVGQLFAVLDARRAPRRNRLAARGPRDTMARYPDRRR